MASVGDENYTSAINNGSQSSEKQDNGTHTSIVENMSTLSIPPEDSIDNKKSDEVEATSDDQDSRAFGKGKQILHRPDAMIPVSRSSTHYNMKHLKRGYAIIIAYSEFDFSEDFLKPRDCADYDANICEVSFKMLGYDVKTYKNLRKAKFLQLLEDVSKMNHSDFDSLVIIVMSHGGVHEKNNQEYIWTYDSKVNTSELWRNFTPEKCPSLAGKPKLFFIQACRGTDCNKGVQLKKPEGLGVQTDGISQSKRDKSGLEDYAIPLHADMLMMYATYTGMFAFKSGNNGLNGSVFIHFLSLVLKEDFKKHDLYTMLLRVTREVATEYESSILQHPDMHESKQNPQMVSTLMRKIEFF